MAGSRIGARDHSPSRGSSSPFVDFDRQSWAKLGGATPPPLTAHERERVRSLGDAADLDEVRDVYLPLSRLLTLHVQEGARLYPPYRSCPAPPPPPRPSPPPPPPVPRP